jgi:hypothetical protein
VATPDGKWILYASGWSRKMCPESSGRPALPPNRLPELEELPVRSCYAIPYFWSRE